MNGSTETFYTRGKLLLSIVERNLGEKIVAVTKRAGARGGTITLGRGTSDSPLGQLLSIGDWEEDVVLTLVTDEQLAPVVEALQSYGSRARRKHGVVMIIDVSHILKHALPGEEIQPDSTLEAPRRSTMKTQADHALIAFIVNRGYADDAMIAARKAGAKGGTILNARGTGTEEDVKFFGITLVPEKELLLIVVDSAIADTVMQAVKDIPYLSQPGSGIAFRIDVEEFWPLGAINPAR